MTHLYEIWYYFFLFSFYLSETPLSIDSAKPRRFYNKWSPDDMEKALKAYANEEVGLNEISRTYAIPKATILRHHRGTNKYMPKSDKGFLPFF